jgi:hypothetical protein
LLTAVDPVVSIVIGVFAFHEAVGHEPARVALEAIGTVVMIVGVLLLGRSPLVLLEDTEHREERSGVDAGQHS